MPLSMACAPSNRRAALRAFIPEVLDSAVGTNSPMRIPLVWEHAYTSPCLWLHG